MLTRLLLWFCSRFLYSDDILRDDGRLYLRRYYLLGGPRDAPKPGVKPSRLARLLPFNAFIHHFHSSDDPELHNHPWRWAWSWILAGGYVEERMRLELRGPVWNEYGEVPCWGGLEDRVMGPGRMNWITDRDFHRVDLIDTERGCWTLFVAGHRTQEWGFLNRESRTFRNYRTKAGALA